MLRDSVWNLAKHTTIYSVGWFANAVSGVILLPIYTRYLSKADYGAVDLVQQVNGIIKILVIASFTYSISRFFHHAKDERGRALAMSTATVAAIVLALLASAAVLLLRWPISLAVFGTTDDIRYVHIGAVTLFFELAFAALSFQFLVAKQSVAFVLLNLVKLVTGIATNLIAVVWLDLGAMGMLYGNLVSFAPVCVIALYRWHRSFGLHVDVQVLRQMVAFGGPMVPAALLATAMHNLDRLLLRPLGSMELVGLFSMGLMFPSMLNSILLTSFNSIWGGAAMFEIAKEKDGEFQTARIASYFMAVFVFLQTTLGVCSMTILNVLVDSSFHGAQPVIAIACVGYSIHAFYLFLSMRAFTHGQTGKMVGAYAIPVVFKVALSLAFVPTYGILASACILSATYAVFVGMCYLLFRNEGTVRFEYRRLAWLAFGCVAALMGAALLPSEHAIGNAAAQAAIVVALAAFLWFGPFLGRDERGSVKRELERVVGRFLGGRKGGDADGAR